ncbi:hypothetical protein [Congregibacter sp.]|uniref:hypothetical protein n=1 Tax=Congregibacter sp. TaxID=2744308 RepID=UPI003F6B8FE8
MMTPERLQELLDIYGSREERWPEDQREGMRACLEAFPELRSQLFTARELDVMLDNYVPATADMEQRIFAALPRSFADRFLQWLLPDVPQLWWRPVVAATLPLVLGLAIGLESQDMASATDWELQERNLLLSATEESWYE